MESEERFANQMPNVLTSESFISARFKEISTLSNLINGSSRVTSIFQRLPKHMRRRAMSHTVKRVPKSLRDAHRRQLEKNKALKVQRSSRKHYRKRARDLLLEYNRRQRVNLWLETHIWHAKRFRMVRKWGYKLAERSCDKRFRASYRATFSHCLIQDVSYMNCIELNGPQQVLLDGFKLITSSECGLSVGAKCWLRGSREGKVTLYHKNSYPFRVIGDITFIWKPDKIEDSTKSRTLWIWCHPSYYKELWDELVDIFGLELIPAKSQDIEMEDLSQNPSSKPAETSSKRNKNVERTKIACKNVPHRRIDKYVNSKSNVTMISLKDTLNRFRLTGPLSNAVLSKALHPAQLFDKYLTQSKTIWWNEYRAEVPEEITFKLLEKYNSPSYFPPYSILGGHVIDPRLFLKRNRTKAIGKNQECEPLTEIEPEASNTALWNPAIRDDISLNKFSNAKINQLRSKLLVPGHDVQLLSVVNSVIPILLVQRPGSTDSDVKLNYGSGWDIIIPVNWAMPVWLSLILCGAKPGGLRESKTINFESKLMPDLAPDSQAGQEHYSQIETTDRDHYFRMPPNKRTNYIKNGFPTPFHHPWNTLLNEWIPSSKQDSYYVLRNKKLLFDLRTVLETTKSNRNRSSLRTLLASISQDKCLVPVSIRMLNKGQLPPFSHICLPNKTDLQNKLSLPVEKVHSDKNKIKRKMFRKEHSKTLKRLRRQRIKQKKASTEKLPLKITKRKQSPTEALVKEYLSQMQDLWIPAKCTSIRNHCSRQIAGFVVNGGFSFMQSRIVGQGYVALQSLFILCDMWQDLKTEPVVLTRSPNCLNYRFGVISVTV
ncbi:ribonucleases P/MRP protein subunit POP1 [Planococcus citri]|uniref:ribonucleases P/MRP protein subunit POP1 n=1 Tax=Planococcus citri TaxID=170843 RepID=UPI0031F7660A